MENIIIFTPKADIKLSEIIKKYEIEQYRAMVKIDFISKAFALEKAKEKEVSDYLQKELGVTHQTAEQISKEIIADLIPLLVKVPDEKLKNPNLREEISKKIFGEQVIKQESQGEIKKNNVLSKIKPPIGVAEALEKNQPAIKKELKGKSTLPSKRSERIKRPILSEENKEPTPKPKTARGSDNYREPIE